MRTRSRSGGFPAPGESARTGSAGRPPEQLLDTPALALGRAARAAVPDSYRDSLLMGRRGRAVVDVACGGNRCADTLGDNLLDNHDAFTSFAAQPHLITGPYGMRRLDPDPVDPDVPSPAGNGCGRAGPGQPHRPDPAVHPPSLITCHPANVMRYALAVCAQPDVFREGPAVKDPARTDSQKFRAIRPKERSPAKTQRHSTICPPVRRHQPALACLVGLGRRPR